MSVNRVSARSKRRVRLAVVLSHPIQYFSPWFGHLALHDALDLRVFYLWDFGVEPRYDPEFRQTIQWDVPLLEKYEYEFIPNRSKDPGTHHFLGLDNPEAVPRLSAWAPDAILLFGYTYMTHVRILLSLRLRGVPLLLRGDSHDLSRPAGWRPRAARAARSLLFRRFAGFLAVGGANADYYRNSGVVESKIHYVPHSIDNERFRKDALDSCVRASAWREDLGIQDGTSVVLFAGKFVPQKRPLDLLSAFIRAEAILRDEGKPAPALLFVGAGPLERYLREMAGERINRTIFFAPFQNQSRMPTVYATGDLLVLPSESETWGLAVNEAMNLGRPVIVSSHVGCGPDLVRHGETGWIFEAGDVEGLTRILTSALRQPGRLAAMGRAAFLHIDRYSYEAATQGLLGALSAILPNE